MGELSILPSWQEGKYKPYDSELFLFNRTSQILSPTILCLTLSRFSRVVRLKSQSHGPRPGQWGVTMLEGHHMTQRQREGFRRCYFLMQSAPRPVFFLKDHQAGSKKICETERTNCQPGSQSRMTAFHSPPQLPLYSSSSSSCLSTRLSSSSPSTGHDYSMKKNDFPKQRHPPLYPLIRAKSLNLTTSTSTGDLRSKILIYCKHCKIWIKVKALCICKWGRWLKISMPSFTLLLFLLFDRTLINTVTVNVTPLITNFPSKATTITAAQITTAASSFHFWG